LAVSLDPRASCRAAPHSLGKLALLLIAGLNMLGFQLIGWRAGRAHRVSAALSIAAWLGVPVCGRSIAYW
jgi:hypothetical protein